MKRRRAARLSRDVRVAQIMEAALAVFRENTYEAASISEIARRAKIVEGSVYRYFENKRDLLTKTVETWYEGRLADYDEHLAGIAGTANRLRFLVWRHLKTIHSDPRLCNLIFQELRADAAYRQTRVCELNRQYTRRTMDVVSEGIAQGEIREDVSPKLVRDLLYGCVEHRTWAYLRGEGDFDPQAMADEIVSVVLNGIRTEAAIEKAVAEHRQRIPARATSAESSG